MVHARKPSTLKEPAHNLLEFIMEKLRPSLLALGLLCSATAHATSWLSTQLVYQPEGWGQGQVYGLNNAGQVIGVISPPPPPFPGMIDTLPMAFVTGANGSHLRPIDPNYQPYVDHCAGGCHTHSTPRAINDSGQIAISSFTPWSMELGVSLAGPGGGTLAPPPGTAGAFGVNLSLNNSGQLAGTYYGPTLSFATGANGSNPQALGMLDQSYDSWVHSINDNGQLLVNGVPAGSSASRTFVTGANATGIAFEVGSFGYQSWATGLNNSAQLFGGYRISAGGEERAFITGANGTGFTDIGSLGGPTFANAISNTGLVVGTSGGTPFVYGYKGNGMQDLNQLIALAPGEFFTEAPDINDRGQIIAESNLGKMYLLSPVPEPTTYAMFAGGLALLVWRARNRPHVSRETPA